MEIGGEHNGIYAVRKSGWIIIHRVQRSRKRYGMNESISRWTGKNATDKGDT